MIKPDNVHGWAFFDISDGETEYGNAVSYISDVAVQILRFCKKTLSDPEPACIDFDCEGRDFLIISDDVRTLIIEDNQLFTLHISKEEMRKQFLADIEEDFEQWTRFDSSISTDEEAAEEAELLKSMIAEIKNFQKEEETKMESGNLLFGNSRGKYHLERDIECEFAFFLDAVGCDSYGYLTNESLSLYRNRRGGITTETFVINPYYWGEDETEAAKPNFIYKPEGVEIQWYKYPLRDAYINKDLNNKQILNILEKCKEAFRKE